MKENKRWAHCSICVRFWIYVSQRRWLYCDNYYENHYYRTDTGFENEARGKRLGKRYDLLTFGAFGIRHPNTFVLQESYGEGIRDNSFRQKTKFFLYKNYSVYSLIFKKKLHETKVLDIASYLRIKDLYKYNYTIQVFCLNLLPYKNL